MDASHLDAGQSRGRSGPSRAPIFCYYFRVMSSNIPGSVINACSSMRNSDPREREVRRLNRKVNSIEKLSPGPWVIPGPRRAFWNYSAPPHLRMMWFYSCSCSRCMSVMSFI